jgi:HEPN domain-containing protein
VAISIPEDLHEVFRHAEAFLSFAQLGRQGLGDNFPDEFNYPLAVNHAFCLEVYLKCLLWLEGKEINREHKLAELFKMLEEPTQEKAKQYYESYRSESPYCQATDAELRRLNRDPSVEAEFNAALENGSEAFVTMRYAYEGEFGRNYLLVPLELGIRKIILERNPDWEPERSNLKSFLGIPPTSQVH